MKLSREQFVHLLTEWGQWVQENDTMEGSLQYEQVGSDEYEVGCALRFGNSMGQGSVRLLPWDDARPLVDTPYMPTDKPTSLLVFDGGVTVQVDGRYEWVTAALMGVLGPADRMHDVRPQLPGLPEVSIGEHYPTGELFGYTNRLLDPQGAVRRITLRNTETGEPVWVNVDRLATCLPGQAY